MLVVKVHLHDLQREKSGFVELNETTLLLAV